ncbi:MAG: glycine cleavage system protein H [Ilumatobacteraceae bacterium]
MALPRDYRYSPDHCWVHVVGESARVGVCSRLVTIGAVSHVTLPALGVSLRRGTPAASLTIAGETQVALAPVSGSVVLVNERLLGDPALVGIDPFGAGWLFEVQLAYEETLEGVVDVDSYLGHLA